MSIPSATMAVLQAVLKQKGSLMNKVILLPGICAA
jgi:hypothetical protein